MPQTNQTLKELLLKFSFFRDLKERDFYLGKMDNLPEKNAQELVKLLEKILKKRDKKVLKVKKRWQAFINKEENKILDSIKKKLAEKESEKIKQIREELK